MPEALPQRDKLGAINTALQYDGPTLASMFEGLVKGMGDLFEPTPGPSLGRGAEPAPSLSQIASDARRLFDTEGEVSAMQYLGQFQGSLTEGQMRQLLATIAEAGVRNPQGDQVVPVPQRVQSLADSMGIRPNPNYPENRVNDLIAHIPTGAQDRQTAINMYNAAGRQATPELMDFLERKWSGR